jgi:hypothetical protein
VAARDADAKDHKNRVALAQEKWACAAPPFLVHGRVTVCATHACIGRNGGHSAGCAWVAPFAPSRLGTRRVCRACMGSTGAAAAATATPTSSVTTRKRKREEEEEEEKSEDTPASSQS